MPTLNPHLHCNWAISIVLLLWSSLAPGVIPVTSGLDVYLNANDIVPTGSGTVDNWPDSNGGGIVASQATAALQPLLVNAEINGNDVVRFDGSNRLTFSTNLFSNTLDERTVFVIFSADANNGHIVGTGSSSSGFLGSYGYGVGVVNNRLFVKANSNSNGPEFAINTLLDSPFEMAAVTFSPTGSYIETRCGYSENDEAFNAYNYSTSTIGATGGLIDAFSGDIAAIAIYDRVLSSSEITAVQTYFSGLYGLSMPSKVDLNNNRTFDNCEPDDELYLNSGYLSVSLQSPPSISGDLDNAIDAQFIGESDLHHNAGTHVYTSNGPMVLRFDLLTSFDIYEVHFWNYFSELYDVDDVLLNFYSDGNGLIGSYQFSPLTSIDPSFAETRAFQQVDGVDYIIATLSGSNNEVDFQNIGFTATPSPGINIPVPVVYVGVLLGFLSLISYRVKRLIR